MTFLSFTSLERIKVCNPEKVVLYRYLLMDDIFLKICKYLETKAKITKIIIVKRKILLNNNLFYKQFKRKFNFTGQLWLR